MNATFPYPGALLVPCQGHFSIPQIVGEGPTGSVSVVGFGAPSRKIFVNSCWVVLFRFDIKIETYYSVLLRQVQYPIRTNRSRWRTVAGQTRIGNYTLILGVLWIAYRY